MLVVALVLAQLVGDDGDEAVVADDTTSTTAAATSTTSPTAPATSTSTTAAPSTTTTTPRTTTTAGRTTTTTTAPRPVVDGSGAVLAAPAAPERRELQPQAGCQSLAAPGWVAECGLFTGKGGAELAWLVEAQGGGRRAFVLRRAQGRQWQVVLEARDENGTRFEDVDVRVADVSGDGAAEAAFGFDSRGAGNVLAVDVVEGPGAVVVHRDLRDGSARVSTGQLDVWDRCCPDAFDHHTIRYTGGAWRVVASVREPERSVPPSHL